MRDLRHHPLLLFVELNLLLGIGAIVMLHIAAPKRIADRERAFSGPVTEGARPPALRLHEAAVVDVAIEIERYGVSQWDTAGGRALQTPERYPSHIFRMNPSDRRAETAGTPGDDFFLEDAFETSCGGEQRFDVTLSSDGNHRVYLVDGNLWVHSHAALELAIGAEDGPARVTFVVLGDIYFLDSFTYTSPEDAVLFVALPRDGEGGGSIWLGDTGYGTLARVDGWLYAAHDVLGGSLDRPTVVHGGLAAGRYVHIDEDRSRRLDLRFDERLAGGRGWVPGL